MGFQKLTGGKAILGGAVILTSPTIYSNRSTSTSSFKIYGTPEVYTSSTDTATGRIQISAGGSTSSLKGGITLGGATRYIKKIPFTSANWTTSVTTAFNTGFQIPASGIVTDAWFHITTRASSITLHAGTTGSAANYKGFLVGIPTTGTGIQGGTLTAATSSRYGTHFTDYTWLTSNVAPSKVNYFPRAAVNVSIARSATNLAMPAGSLYIEYIVPGY